MARQRDKNSTGLKAQVSWQFRNSGQYVQLGISTILLISGGQEEGNPKDLWTILKEDPVSSYPLNSKT